MYKDDDFQLYILRETAKNYPNKPVMQIDEKYLIEEFKPKFVFNLRKLMAQDLIDSDSLIESADGIFSIGHLAITEKGLEYLEFYNVLNSQEIDPQKKIEVLDFMKNVSKDVITTLTSGLIVNGATWLLANIAKF